MKIKSLIISIFLLSIALLLYACGSKPNPADNPTEPLKICSSLGKEMTELLVEDFARKNKLQTIPKVTYLPSGTTQERFAFIKDGHFDCWLGGSAEEYFSANGQGMLQIYAARESFKVPAALRNRRNLWTTLYLSHIAIISNKNKLRELGLYAPNTWDELLHSHLRDEIVIPSLELGGSGFGMVTSIWQLRGKEEALKYAALFNRQQPAYASSTIDAADMVYRGKKTVAVLPVGYALELEEKHSHMFATVVQDANRDMLTGVALLKNAPTPSMGQSFIDYLMSDDSEKILHDHGYKYFWHVKHYPNNSGRKELVGTIKVPTDDLSWTSTYKSEIIRQWLEAQ